MTQFTRFVDMPRDHYGLVLSDPPWEFLNYSKKGVIPSRKDIQDYKPATLAELKAMPIKANMAKDSVLIMWVISSHIHHALEVGEAWGLTFKSLGMIWNKELKGRAADQFSMYPPEPKYRIGMGYHFRQEAEISLVFTTGKPKRLHKGVRQIINAPRGRHSEKPEEAYSRCVKLYGGPYLDMFSRKTRPGWDAFGDQAGSFD